MDEGQIGELAQDERNVEAPAPGAGGPGFVYVISNPSMPELVKIGLTARPVEDRMYDLHSTGVPTPFVKEFAVHVDDARLVEQEVHRLLVESRVSMNREFFRTAADIAKKSVLHASLGHVTNADALPEFARYHDEMHAETERRFALLIRAAERKTRFWKRLSALLVVPAALFALTVGVAFGS